jgi:Ca-activated chloride channel family protein
MVPKPGVFRIDVMNRRIARRRLAAGLLAAGLVALDAGAFALGILVPRRPEFSPIQLADAEVRTEITNNLAKTRVVQEFFNPNPRQLEADFFFPVPRGANVTDFVLYMNGKPVKGEVLEKEKAREIYEGIVRRMRDPGLLEWIDYNLFKVRVFPVPPNGTQKIELEFAQPLEADQGLFKYAFPLKTPKSGLERTRQDGKVKFTVDINSDEAIRNVYSPSHTVDTDLKDPKHAKVALASPALTGATGDFVLFYEYSNKEIALSLVATRPGTDDGYFALMLSPQAEYDKAKSNPNDVTFVIDTSGSMLDDNKIEQARRALAYCVSQLREGDRFNLVRFSTETEKFRDTPVEATAPNIADAKQWIERLRATGGTNISGALREALSSGKDSGGSTSATADRVHTVVFITDGLPTIGITQPERILDEVKGMSRGSIRIFTFGVGNDVNTKLLDGIADAARAVSEYIRPGQDLEVPISKFFDKISRPAMTGLRLDMTVASIFDMYPKELPDLFYGTQLTVFGRYKRAGPVAVRLAGTIADKPVEFVYEKALPEREPANEFVEKLWGTRKIGYLLDEIRAHGESGELRDEVIRLAKKYGVVTPYTSYLVAEDIPPAPTVVDRPSPRPMMLRDPVQLRSERRHAAPATMPQSTGVSVDSGREMRFGAGALKQQSGVEAVRAAGNVRALKEVTQADRSNEMVSTAGGKTFRLVNGIWMDSDIKPDEVPKLVIKQFSNAYFAAVRANPKLADIFALGDRVQVKLAGGIVEISDSGKEQLTPDDKRILAP